MTQKMLLSYVAEAAPELVGWIDNNVSFPNAMVDRITPVTAPEDITYLKENTGIDDAWPVVCEPFKQWVIEDNFIAGRPAWEKVGAQFVEDVVPYEKMKLSLLNAGHSVIGLLGALMGYNTIDEAVNNPNIRTFLNNYMDVEVTPTLGNLKGINLHEYKQSLLERFGNINIKDQIDRICSETSAKFPIFILPTINSQLAAKETIELAAFVTAAWAIYSLGIDEKGNKLIIKDALATTLHQKAMDAQKNPALFLETNAVFGQLKESEIFVATYTKSYRDIEKYGIEKCVINKNNKALKAI